MKKAIVTLCTEELMLFGQYSHPSFVRYAERVGADFIVIDGKNRQYPGMNIVFEKYQIGNLLDTYQRIMYVDTDAFIKPACDDLFEMVPYECFAGTHENAGNVPADEHLVGIINKALGQINWDRGLMNDGVFLVSDVHKNIFDITQRTPPDWMWNLYLLNYNVNRFGHKTYILHHKYNGMFVYGYRNKEDSDTDALIVHYAACGDLRTSKLKFLHDKYLL